MLKIQLEELEIFVTAVESGNFTKTASLLGITASVVSRTIKKLENKLTTTLFTRTTRKLYLTQEGEWLYQRARELVNQAQGIETYLGDKAGAPNGRLVVDAATPFSIHAIGPLIAGFNQRYPGVRVILQSTESNVDLIEHKVDVAIRIGQLQDSSLKARKLGECFRKLYASPGYIELFGAPDNVSQLSHHACLGFANVEKLNTWPLATDDGSLLKVAPATFADNGETLKQLAIKGCGIACLSSFTADDDVRSGRLVPLLETQTIKQPIPVYAVFYAVNGMDRRLRCFLDHLSENIRLS